MSHFATEAERAILGAIIAEPDTLLQASDIICPEDFSTTSHRLIYNALFDLYQLGEKTDFIALIDRLKEKGHIQQAGGEDYIIDIANDHISSASIKLHSRIVHDKSLLRRAGAWAQTVADQSKNGIEDIPEWLGKVESELVELAQSAKSKTSPYTDDILKTLDQYWDDSLNGKEICIAPPAFLKEPIPGFYPKHLWIIGGYTGKGKSKFLNQLLVDAMDAGAKILLFSLEDSREEKMMGLISNLADISYKALITGRITGYEDRIEKAKKMIAKWNPIIYDDVRTVDDIRLKSKKHKIREGVDIIAIDYIQNLAIRNTLYETMADAAGKLYALVKELKVTCLAVSQIDNESAKKESNIIGLKGAGELAAAAHIVLWLTRVKGQGKERHMDCTIKKNRPFGETAKIELTFTEKWTGLTGRSL
ncbi:MAG: replicative DNA helicase [Nitrospirae bacterium]|nr:MAG: replicative DNA helicase [Nitrospirota bacterium]